MYKQPKTNTLLLRHFFISQHFHQHVSVSNPAIFRVIFGYKNTNIVKCVKSRHNIKNV